MTNVGLVWRKLWALYGGSCGPCIGVHVGFAWGQLWGGIGVVAALYGDSCSLVWGLCGQYVWKAVDALWGNCGFLDSEVQNQLKAQEFKSRKN